jgi:hypothetical protein
MQAQQNPQIASKIGGIVASVAELDCDIIIDEVPDVIASQEQFAMLVDLKKMDTNNELPFRALVQASSIKDKGKMLDEMDKAKQPSQDAQQVKQVQMAGAVAEVKETESRAMLNVAKAREAGTPEMGQSNSKFRHSFRSCGNWLRSKVSPPRRSRPRCKPRWRLPRLIMMRG